MPLPKPFLLEAKNGISQEQIPLLSVLLAAACLTSLTGGAIAPVFPDIVQQMDLDPRWAGTLVSIPRLTVAIASPLLGFLADRAGKLLILIPSLLGFALFGIAGALSDNFISLLILRALVGVANGGISAASLGFVSHLFEGETRSRLLGYTASIIAVTSIFVPLLAGWLGSFHWRWVFVPYGLAIPVAIAAQWVIKEPPPSSSDPELLPIKPFRHSLTQMGVLLLLFNLFVTAIIFYTVIVYAPLYFQMTMGVDSVVNGMILATRAIGAAIIAALGVTRVSKWLGKTATTSLGLILMGITLAILPFLTSVEWALLTAFGFGAGFGLVMPNLYDDLADQVASDQRATLLALGTGMTSLGQFFSPILLGPVWEMGRENVFLMTATVAIILALLQFIRKNKPLKPL